MEIKSLKTLLWAVTGWKTNTTQQGSKATVATIRSNRECAGWAGLLSAERPVQTHYHCSFLRWDTCLCTACSHLPLPGDPHVLETLLFMSRHAPSLAPVYSTGGLRVWCGDILWAGDCRRALIWRGDSVWKRSFERRLDSRPVIHCVCRWFMYPEVFAS